MPELPEVETIRRSLEPILIDKTVDSIDVRERKQFIGDENQLIGKKVSSVTRKGKVLTIVFDNSLFVSIHLKLTGQILYTAEKNNAVFKNNIPQSGGNTMPSSVTRVIFYFQDNSALYFNDVRKFGWVKLTDKIDDSSSVDILSPFFTLEYFSQSISNSRKPIKAVLLDQDKFTGIGNIYDNDSLWEAGIHPARKTNTLTHEEIKELYQAIKKIINEGIECRGSSAKDEMYLLPNSEKGEYQYHFKVYHRNGEPCLRDKTIIERISIGGRGTFFCPTCQK